ncbi:MAG: hypothetical protein H0U67_09595, partial [Gemmatimonadetes bacterium]|nr:hypothetical protein [Gemmatimonadota bacterium]
LLGRITNPQHRADAGFQRTLTQRLTELKEGYREAYLALHARARLGAGEDRRKDALNRDPRLRQLRSLASLEGMPKQQLRDWEDRLLGLRTCFALTPKPQLRPLHPRLGAGGDHPLQGRRRQHPRARRRSWTGSRRRCPAV